MALYTCTKDITIYIKQNNFTPMILYAMYKRHEQNNFTPMILYTMYKRHEQNSCTPMVCIPCIQKQDTTTLRDINRTRQRYVT